MREDRRENGGDREERRGRCGAAGGTPMSRSASPVAYEAVSPRSFEDTVARARELLAAEGFGVLTEIDVKATLKKKLDVDFRKYVILGACNPPLANRALNADLDVGLLLPCNVIVYEDGAGSAVSIIDPMSMLQTIKNGELEAIAHEAQSRLKRVIAKMGG